MDKLLNGAYLTDKQIAKFERRRASIWSWIIWSGLIVGIPLFVWLVKIKLGI